MHCLKCGKETEESQIFCPECLQMMDSYPVKPGTPVILPQRNHTSGEKANHKKEQTPEEQLRTLRNISRILLAAVAVLSVLLCITGVLLLRTLDRTAPAQEAPPNNIGRNYTTTSG